MSSRDSAAYGSFERALRGVSGRVRLLRALRALAFYATLGGLGAALAGVLVAVGWLGPADRTACWAMAALLAVLGAVLGALRRPSLLSVALLVDRTHPFGGRIAAGVELAASGSGGELGRLAVADGLARCNEIDPRRAISFTVPAHARSALLAGLAALVASGLTPPGREAVRAPLAGAPRLRPLAVHEDDLGAIREVLGALPERPRSPAMEAEIAEINALVEALSRRELDRTETLRRLGAIAEGLREGRSGTLAATAEALAPLGRPLARSPASAPLGEALAARDLERAAAELERLSERVAAEPPSAAELERLREAMAAAAEALEPEALRREREALEEQRDRLLRREEEERAMDPAERSAREAERERELERLRRDIEERREREEELEALRRELDELGRERDEAGGQSEAERAAMERAAEAMRRYADESAGAREREELAREIEAMRELVRRMREGEGEGEEAGAPGGGGEEGGGEGEGSRMDRFVLRARGEGGEGGTPIGTRGRAGEEGEGSAGEGGEGRRGAEGEAPGSGGEDDAEDGSGGRSGREMLVLGEGEDRLMLPGGGGTGAGSEPGEEPSEGEREGGREGSGEGADTGRGAPGAEDASGRSGTHTTLRVAGAEGAGPTRSEVIRTSAARGFASRDYRDVYGDYRRHAEESLDDESIPPGYRFYVERYFQLIRPRE